MYKYLSLLLLAFSVQPVLALDNSIDKEVTVNDGGDIGAPLPPKCIGDKALQWDGRNWGCKVAGGTRPAQISGASSASGDSKASSMWVNASFTTPLTGVNWKGQLSEATLRDNTVRLIVKGRSLGNTRYQGKYWRSSYPKPVSKRVGSSLVLYFIGSKYFFTGNLTNKRRLVYNGRGGLRDTKGNLIPPFDYRF